jgi:hypothetical protein
VGDVAEALQAIRVECWSWSEAADPRLNIVITLKHGAEQVSWYGKELVKADQRPGEWTVLRAEQLFRDQPVQADDTLTILWWKRSDAVVYVDDISVSFIGAMPLGAGPPVATPHRSLPYAMITCSEVRKADLSADGVPAGPQVIDVPVRAGSALHWTLPLNSAVGYLVRKGLTEDTLALVRPYCPVTGDLGMRERLEAWADPNGVRITAYDVDADGHATEGTAALLQISPPAP